MKPRRAIGVSDMGCNKIEPDSIEDGIIKSVNQRKRATTPAGKAVIGLGYLRIDPNLSYGRNLASRFISETILNTK